MGKIVGVVTKITKGKGIVELGSSTFERLNITVSNDEQELVIQRLVKPGNDGSRLLNQRADVTYTERQLTNQKGEKFTARSADSKGFVLLDAIKPSYNNKFAAPAASPINNIPVPSAKEYKSTSYNSEGARHGMIVNNAVLLANHRGDSSFEALMYAAHDLTLLTKFVEEGAVLGTDKVKESKSEKPSRVTKNLAKDKVSDASYAEEDPFEDS